MEGHEVEKIKEVKVKNEEEEVVENKYNDRG